MSETAPSDRGQRELVARNDQALRHKRHDSERGQAMVEFALILFPLLLLVTGIIYFGNGLNLWLDMNRVANQGVRWAVVNNWPPQCKRGETCSNFNNATACTTVLGTSSKAKLQEVLRCQLRGSGTSVTVCFPGKTPTSTTDPPTIGDPVRIKITRPYTFFFLNRVGITLKASATMRLEQIPQASLKTGAGGPTCT
jgi:Flp pilus assembly protein TadG